MLRHLTGRPHAPRHGPAVAVKIDLVDLTNWTVQEQSILKAMKSYRAIVADNGNFFSISVTPDDRWPASCFDHLRNVGITNFEVIQTTGRMRVRGHRALRRLPRGRTKPYRSAPHSHSRAR